MDNNFLVQTNDIQDRNSEAWIKLCALVDKIAEEERDEFSPYEELGDELYAQIYTLPESIAKLKKVKKLSLYDSNLKRIPPEIGEMEALEYFDPYTSYDLHWFPYEITNCKHLKDSRVSTRTLYGNYKNRMEFPSLENNPVKYYQNEIKCSICKKPMKPKETNQLWITLQVATDILPLLANVCLKECEDKLPQSVGGYVKYAHKGGSELIQPDIDDWDYLIKFGRPYNNNNPEKENNIEAKSWKDLKLIKLIRKIWEK